MEIYNNIETKDEPIRFRFFNKEDDFKEEEFDITDSYLEQDEKGYVSQGIVNKVTEDFTTKNSVVINSAVGQGKTTAIFELIEKYYKETDDLIFVVAPFRDLVEKYVSKLNEILDVEVTSIFDIEKIDKDDREKEAKILRLIRKSRVQVLTVNLLLRDAGDFYFQNKIKSEYLDKLIGLANSKEKQAYLFMDEIHSSINSFTQENIFQFFKFNQIIQKIFYLSATYSERSLMVIKTLASLTDKKIQLLSSNRNPRKSFANLYLHITSKRYSKNKTKTLKEILENIITDSVNKDEPINILTYSKDLAKSIVKHTKLEPIEESLFYVFAVNGVENKLNLVVSENNSKTSNDFDENKYNIGTTFNTGIDISNGTYIIIMPDIYAIQNNKSEYGVFSEGSDAIIQAIGRMRGEGNIHIVLGKSKNLIHKSYIGFGDFQKFFKLNNNHFHMPFFQNEERNILKKAYFSKKKKVKDQISQFEVISSENGKKFPIRFPTYPEWIFKEGSRYLYFNYLYFGKQITPFVIWASLHNQFQNCSLTSISFHRSRVNFQKENIYNGLDRLFNKHFSESYYHVLNKDELDLLNKQEEEEGSDYVFQEKDGVNAEFDSLEHTIYDKSDLILYDELMEVLNQYSIYIDNKPLSKINVRVKTMLVKYIANRKKGLDYSAEKYFLDIVSFSKDFIIDEDQPEEWYVKGYDLIIAAQEITPNIEKLSDIFQDRGFLYKSLSSEHNDEVKQLIDELMPHFRTLKSNDDLISGTGFDLMRKMEKGYMYKKVYKAFFNSEEFLTDKRGRDIVDEGTTGSVLKFINQKEYSNLSNGLNLYYDYEEKLDFYKDQFNVIATL